MAQADGTMWRWGYSWFGDVYVNGDGDLTAGVTLGAAGDGGGDVGDEISVVGGEGACPGAGRGDWGKREKTKVP